MLFTVSAPGPAWADEGRRGPAGHPAARRRRRSATSSRRSATATPAPAPRPHRTLRRSAPGSPLPPFPVLRPPRRRSRARAAHPARRPLVDLQRAELSRLADAAVQPGRTPVSPHLYRGLVDAAWDGLDAVRPRATTPSCWARPHRFAEAAEGEPVLLPHSVGPTLRFVREMYCLSDSLSPAARPGRPGTRLPRHRRGPGPVQGRPPGAVRGARLGPPPLHAHARAELEGPRAHRHRDLATISQAGADPRPLAPGLAQLQPPAPVDHRVRLRDIGPTPTGRSSYARQAGWMSWGEFVAFRNRAGRLLRPVPPARRRAGAQPAAPVAAALDHLAVRASHRLRAAPSRRWRSTACRSTSAPPARGAGRCACSAPSGRPPTTPGCRRRSSSAAGAAGRCSAPSPPGARAPTSTPGCAFPGRGLVRLTYLAPGTTERVASRSVARPSPLAGGRDDPQDAVVAVVGAAAAVAVVGQHVERAVGRLDHGAQTAELALEQRLVAR